MSKKNCSFYVKIHENLKGRVAAICDSDLIGKIFEDGNFNLDVSENFYKGDLVDEKEIIKILKNEKNLNIVGKNIINLALELELIDKTCVLSVKNILYAQLIAL